VDLNKKFDTSKLVLQQRVLHILQQKILRLQPKRGESAGGYAAIIRALIILSLISILLSILVMLSITPLGLVDLSEIEN
jgi:hypothetical protein